MRAIVESDQRVGAGETAKPTSRTSAKARMVLFVTHTPGYGGTEKHLLELLARMNEDDVRPVILCTEADPYTERLTFVSASKIVVRSETLRSPGDWYRLFKRIKPDAVVLVYGTLTQHPWYASVAARLAGVPKLYAIQHLIPPPLQPKEELTSPKQLLRRLIGRRVRTLIGMRIQPRLCHRTICVSNAVRNALLRDYRFPPKKTITIHNGVSVSEFTPSDGTGAAVRSRLGIGPDEFVLVCVARLGEEKGIDILFQAMRELLNRGLSFKCIVVGEGYFRDNLLELIRTLGLTEHVFMVGFFEDVRPFLYAANLFVLTSHKEGLPFAVLEAMSCGLPSVVTDVGGNAEAVAQNVNGLVVKPGSPGEAVEAIAHLMSRPQELATMAAMARSRACQYFDIEARMADIKRTILN